MSENSTSRTIIGIVILGMIIWFFYLVRDILLPFILSGILAYVLSPLVKKIETTGLKRVYAVIIVYLAFAIILIVTITPLIHLIIGETNNLKGDIPKYVRHIEDNLIVLQVKVEKAYPMLKERAVIDSGVHKLQDFLKNEVTNLPSYIISLFSMFSLLILIPLVTFFFTLGSKNMMDKLVEIIPNKYIETSLSIFWEIDDVLGKFIRGQVIESMFVGILSMIGLFILGINYALLIGIIAGIANLIPYLGPFVGLIIGVTVAFIQYQEIAIVVKVIILFWGVQLIDNNVVQPIVLSQGVDLNPAIIIFAVMAGAQIYGVIGMLLAVPIAGIIKVTLGVLLKK